MLRQNLINKPLPQNRAVQIDGQAMKIPVHEIEGDYYCAIDDVIKHRAQRQKQSTYPMGELRKAYEIIPIYWHLSGMKYADGSHYSLVFSDGVPEPDDATVFYLGGNNELKTLGDGIWRVSLSFWACNGLDYFRLKGNVGNPVSYVGISEIIRHGHRQSVCDLVTSTRWTQQTDEELLSIPKTNTKDFYITLLDAQVYLADSATDDDFIMPNSHTESQPTTTSDRQSSEVLPYLDPNHEKYAPLLAVAVDIWERLFIHSEGNQNQGLEPRAIDLIGKHYPNLTTDKEKNSVAYIATTHLGKTKKSQKNKNNG